MALLGQRAENNWIGVRCGIMDQLVIARGKKGHATLIDCRDLSIDYVPLPHEVSIVIMDTATRRGLVNSAYNDRRARCEEAAKVLGVKNLRDISFEEWGDAEKRLPETCRSKARHVISENHRVMQAVSAMRRNDMKTLGILFNESHKSLREDYEVTNEALDCIVNFAQCHEACYGARMTGAGFGGCAVALVKKEGVADFKKAVGRAYQQKMNLVPRFYTTSATDGVGLDDEKIDVLRRPATLIAGSRDSG
jgi:galactokinase